MKLLHVVSSLDPAAGGPMEGVLQSSLACLREGHTVEVATLDDPGAPYLVGYPLPVYPLGPGWSNYGYAPRFGRWMRDNVRAYDAVIINGLWMYHGIGSWWALRKSGIPYFAFTHGMLDPWFKKTYPLKHLKKWLFWPWSDYLVLRDARGVLFTCEEERLLARQSFWLYKARERVVSFGTTSPPLDAERLREAYLAAYPALRGKRLLLFLSRIHEKKGCDLMVEAFARVASADPDLHLVVAGPDHTGLSPKLRAQAEALGVADRISWPGMLRGDQKWGAFHAAEVYLLPSHQENFGIAVAEALGCNLPVLISNKVNIWREIESARAGFVDTDTADGCERTLRRWLRAEPAERDAMRQAAGALFQRSFTVEAMAHSLIKVVDEARGPGAG